MKRRPHLSIRLQSDMRAGESNFDNNSDESSDDSEDEAPRRTKRQRTYRPVLSDEERPPMQRKRTGMFACFACSSSAHTAVLQTGMQKTGMQMKMNLHKCLQVFVREM